MEKSYEYVKNAVVNFKLDWCCWLAPVRIGLFITGYLNIILAVISLVGIAEEGFAPVLKQVQDSILEDYATKTVPMLAYTTELAFHVILLAALYRNDIKLMRVYMKYCIAAIITSIMFYSLVVAAIGVVVATTLVLSIVFQLYVLILVRSMIVEMRLQQKNLELPTIVMSSLVKQTQDHQPEEKPADVETPAEDSVHEENGDKPRLETVDEHPKEETTNEKV